MLLPYVLFVFLYVGSNARDKCGERCRWSV